MKIYTLNEPFEVTKIEDSGKKIQITLRKDVVKEQDLLFLNGPASLAYNEYQAIKVNFDRGLYFADLVKVIGEEG